MQYLNITVTDMSTLGRGTRRLSNFEEISTPEIDGMPKSRTGLTFVDYNGYLQIFRMMKIVLAYHGMNSSTITLQVYNLQSTNLFTSPHFGLYSLQDYLLQSTNLFASLQLFEHFRNSLYNSAVYKPTYNYDSVYKDYWY
jgi:hypothetical protein